jgi:hypothetical protein
MKTATNYIAEIETTIAGIPCLIGVTEYDSVAGSYSYNAASDMDYYGYTECDWEVLDRKGYKAAWLERKLTSKDSERINNEISNYFAN